MNIDDITKKITTTEVVKDPDDKELPIPNKAGFYLITNRNIVQFKSQGI